MNKIKKTSLYLIGFATLLLIITVVINLPAFDEELLPEVAAIKNIQAEPFSEDNAYPALLAISGPSGKTLHQSAEEVRVFLNQKITETGLDFLNKEERQQLIGKDHDASWRNTYQSCNSRKDHGCMNDLIRQFKQSDVLDSRLTEQLTRYQELIQKTAFTEATQMDLNSPLVGFTPVMEIKRLFLTHAYINQSSNDYLAIHYQDIEFWRTVLKNSHLLITKMITIVSLSDNVQSLSTAIQQGRLSASQLTELLNKIKVLNHNEVDLGTTFEFEYKYGMSLLDQAYTKDNIGGFVESWLFQPQATHNTSFLYATKPLKKIAKLSAADFYQYTETNKHAENFKSPVSWSPSMLYNPTGKILIGLATPAYTDYFGRMHDLNGLFHLLKLQIEIALNSEQAVEQVIAQSKYTNPYTLKPMNYNKDNHSIYFECMDKTSNCELDL